MYAIVTGASSGIGLHYAEQLARDYKYDLLLVSNQPAELQQVAEDLHARFGVETYALAMDLATTDAAEQVFAFSREKQMDVEVLVNNAGILIFDLLTRTDPKRMEIILHLHIVTLTKLCRLFGETMSEREKGFIINMSSMSAWTALPTIPLYNATKNYVLAFSKSLWYELMPKGVHVLAVAPGSTNTSLLPFPEKMGRLLLKTGVTMQPETLVRRALRRLFHTKNKVYLSGAWSYVIVPFLKHLPNGLIFFVMRKMGLAPKK